MLCISCGFSLIDDYYFQLSLQFKLNKFLFTIMWALELLNFFTLLLLNVMSASDSAKYNTKLIDTVRVYPTLNFEKKSTSPFWIWDEQMELRYWKTLINWNKKPLKVIVVPFSHNDAGWLETFEEYFEKKTRYILDNIVNILPELEDMTFVWSEICFLQRWWDRASEKSKNILRKLIDDGKLEILTGGWVMPDEATTHVFSLHNQLTEGHQWIWENLGLTVVNSWSIDPFGCSSVMAYLLAASGIKSLVLQRVHYSWKEYLSVNGNLDLIWEQNFEGPTIKVRVQQSPGYSVTDSCGPATSICGDYDFNSKISDAEHITFQNIHKKAEIILGLYGRIGSLTVNNVALVTLGGDFRFDNASEWLQQYRNYRAIFDYVNGNKNIYKANLRFGTLRDFFHNVEKSNISLRGDFFPYADLYADNSLAHWTGYYSTRPYWKKLARSTESLLRACEVLYTLTLTIFKQTPDSEQHAVSLLERQYSKLVRARRSVSLFQHHDGITGTAKARVMKDYKNKLMRSFYELKFTQKLCVEFMMNVTATLNVENQNHLKKTIVVFNSLPYSRTEVIGIKTDFPNLVVTGSNGTELQHQINCIYTKTLGNEKYDLVKERFELVFISQLKPLSLTSFEIKTAKEEFYSSGFKNYNSSENSFDGLILMNSKQKVSFSENGLVSGISKEFGNIYICTNLKAYTSDEGSSGAYLFKPIREKIKLYSHSLEGNIVFSDGPLFKEVTARYGEDYVISTRIYGTSSYLNEIIEMKITYNISECNTELFVEFVTGLRNTRFYTDVNGFEMRERVRHIHQPIEANYFPMTSMAYLENTDYKFAILTDHSHGVASLNDGSIEVMLDRRISEDDKRGLDEGVEDKLKTTSTLYMLFQRNTQSTSELLNVLGLHLNNPSNLIFVNETSKKFISFINNALPYHIHLLNLRIISNNDTPSKTALLTLHNVGFCPAYEETFPPESTFNGVNLRKIIKTTLTGIKEEDELNELSEIRIKPLNMQSFKLFF